MSTNEGKHDVIVSLISASDVQNRKFFGKQSPTAQIHVTGCSFPQVSRAAINGGRQPVWSQEFTFSVEDSVLHSGGACVKIEIFPEQDLSGKSLGTATIPLLPSMEKICEAQYGAHLIRKRSGKHRGTLNASVTVLGNPFSPELLASLKNKEQSHLREGHRHNPHGHSHANHYSNIGPAYGPYSYPHPSPMYHQPMYGPSYVAPPVHHVHHRHGYYGRRGYGGSGMGVGAGLLLGGVGGLLLADAIMD